jgi:sec-independent protein translocase protein TatB
MFDLDVSKMLVFGIVALAVIPPKDLPRVLRTVGKYVGQMRRMAADFQGQFMEALKEADVESVKKEFESIEASAKIDSSFDPVMAMRSEITKAAEDPKPALPIQTVVHEPAVTEAIEDEPTRRDVIVAPLAAEPEPANDVAEAEATDAKPISAAVSSAP